MSGHEKITRDRLLQGANDERLAEAERMGLLVRKSEEERIAIRDAVIRDLPPGDVWVFGYGSLIWNPAFHFDERRQGRIHGWHRRFCLETPLGRGSPDCPGLVLGLDRGGSCQGVAFRIREAEAAHELDIVFKRELVSDAYRAHLVTVHGDGGPTRAVTFTMNRQSPRYCGHLDLEKSAAMIAEAEGWLGPCSDYLFNTAEHLKELGLKDHGLFRLEKRVRELQAAR